MSRSFPRTVDGVPFVGVALTGAEALHLLGDSALRDRAARESTFTIVGIDRLSPLSAGGRAEQDVDPSIVAAALAAEDAGPLLVAAAARYEFPYNLARRVLSLDHLSRGTSGLVTGLQSRGEESPGDDDARAAADVAVAVTKLWQSWPKESIVGDKETGVLVDAGRISRIDHTGAVDIAGPLSVPTSPQDTPVLCWYAADRTAVRDTPAIADLVVLGGAPDVREIRSAVAELDGRALPIAAIPIGASGVRGEDAVDEVRRRVAALADAGASGVLLRTAEPSDAAADLRFLLGEVLPALPPAGVVRGPAAGTLRARLGTPAPASLLTGAAPAFPPPTTAVYR